MAGSKAGAQKAVQTIKNKYGTTSDGKIKMLAEIGARGGSVKGVKKGFAADKDRARWAGAKGGAKSRRSKTHV